MKKAMAAIIDIGSSSIRMTIYEIQKKEYTIIEELKQSVRLGKDSFYGGKISRPTIDECVHILKKYKQLCSEYNVTRIKAVATTAVREAVNVDVFLDNIWTLTDIDVEIIHPFRESEYVYHALVDLIESTNKKIKKDYWGFIEIGAGNVEITIAQGNCIIYSRSLPLGILKIRQMFKKEFHGEEDFDNFLHVMIEHELQNVKRSIPTVKINRAYAIGSEIETTARIITGKDDNMSEVNLKDLDNFCSKLQNYSEEEIVYKLKIPYEQSETFFAANLILLKVLKFFSCKDVCVPQISLRDGIIRSVLVLHNHNKYLEQIEVQLKENALNLGRSLNFDEKHAVKVNEIALKIFDQTKNIHHLGARERCYLVGASILHDIGSTLSYRSHHKHSLYIINAQDFFSFDRNEIKIIANIARYHRKSSPKNSHPDYFFLSHKDKMIVMKLASILRIADSLDNTHLQLINDIELVIDDNEIIIKADVKDLFFSEVYAFKYKKGLFEDFFGKKVKLKLRVKDE